jgi:hypothetical protein
MPGMSGSDVWSLVAGGMYDEVAEYCLQDVRATAAIYARIRPYLESDVDAWGDTYAPR